MKRAILHGLFTVCGCVALAAQSHSDIKLTLDKSPIDIKVFNSKKAAIAQFGKNSVRDDSVCVGEGSYEKCTTIYNNNRAKTLSIIWCDTLAKKQWQKIYWGDKATKWVINGVIKYGVSLKQLEKINTKPFTLTGFEWDYSGTIVDYNGGELDFSQTQPIRIILRLLPKTFTGILEKEENTVMGDKNIPSSDPVMQKLNPQVYQIILVKEEKQ